ncbi:MAG TPA: NAD(P)H-dependent oxidoreductase [Solirubrobacteraceae bacterium]|nr:NAD(P)H-dependent oxidoreductase [Solirubrobacteraceae bacterium]
MPRIQLILGSTREGRFGEKAAGWALARVARREDLSVEPVDLRDYPMPFYEQVVPPARRQRDYPPEVARWAEKVDAADGYLIVTPEYNHGYPAELKNALDQVFPELNRKPVAFIGYGNTGGARAIEQLRLVCVELEMAPLRHAVHILPSVMIPARQAEGPFDPEVFASLDERLDTAVTDLVWWARALARARAEDPVD